MLFSEVTHQSSSGLYSLIPLIVFLPVLGLLINMVFGKRMGEKFTGITASLAALGSFAIAVLMFIALNQDGFHTVQVPFAEWLHIGSFELDWVFRIDTLSVTMMLVVSGVGSLIHIYAAGYMHFDVRYKEQPAEYTRFFIYMNLFIAMMMILVTGDSYLMLFVGWEGVGLCSYLLIGFWFNRNPDASVGVKNSIAGKKAFVVNRIGDFGFLIAMFITFWAFGSLQFDEIFHEVNAGHFEPVLVTAVALFMLLGVTGKSAQLPLFVWLPDAMAGPTPVSALIHAATMVTAGVYLIARSAPMFNAVPEAQGVVALVGAITALVAATIAVGQYDIKKVLAYSTVSQLGFMVAAVGMGAYVAGVFHLVTHAFFKALLFLSAGSVILAVERGHHPLEGDGGGEHHDDHHDDDHGEAFDPQDMRNMGGLRKKIPVTFWVYMAGTLALAGIPPLAGFFSKDEILLDASLVNTPVYIMLTLAAFLTAFYMGRQVWMVFFGKPRHHAAEVAKESPPVMTIPLIILAVLSVVGGFMNFPGVHQFGHWLEHTFEYVHVHLHTPEFSVFVAVSSTVLALVAIFLSWLLYGRKPIEKGQADPLTKLGVLYKALEDKWYLDEIYEFLIVTPYKKLAHFFAQVIDWDLWHDWFHDSVVARGFRGIAKFLANPVDLGIIDGVSKWLAQTVGELAEDLRSFQNGFIRSYALSVFFGVVLILGYLILFR